MWRYTSWVNKSRSLRFSSKSLLRGIIWTEYMTQIIWKYIGLCILSQSRDETRYDHHELWTSKSRIMLHFKFRLKNVGSEYRQLTGFHLNVLELEQLLPCRWDAAVSWPYGLSNLRWISRLLSCRYWGLHLVKYHALPIIWWSNLLRLAEEHYNINDACLLLETQRSAPTD